MLSVVAFATADRGLGITTPFEHTAAIVGEAIAPSSALWTPYFASQTPVIGWEWMLVVGVLLGSLVSSTLSGDRRHPVVPTIWRERFGPSIGLRMAGAFVGGLVLMLGARLARGCTSGHGITGALQLAVSSWIFISVAFCVSIAVATTIFGRPKLKAGE